MIDLLKIKDPTFLKSLNQNELNELASEVRSFLIEKISETGGHLSSNLGDVELIIALHKVFDSPSDKFIFDVGHQAYTHKILTGRANDFDRLRQFEGLSGYIKREESIHDIWEAGHSSTAIAALAGFEIARESNHQDYKVIAVVGDGSLNSGLSFEALNFLGHQSHLHPLIILNDNDMSISKNVGTLAKLLNSMRSSKTYVKASKSGSHLPRFFHDLKRRIGDMLRGFAKNMTIFDELGFRYYGPIDGHDFKTLIKYLELVKKLNKPIVLHVVTKKGKGYPFAENDIHGVWHGVAPFNIDSGKPKKNMPETMQSWSNIISKYMEHYAESHPNFRVVIPAMITGSGFIDFQERYPEQLIDVGICESFAVCFSGALSMNAFDIFVPIYSSFLQRAYDQISHDIARQNLHVVFGIDRAGLVGEDGETHQGIYDIAYIKHIPNIEIVQPKDAIEAFQLLDYAFKMTKNAIAIRYSRGKTTFEESMFSNLKPILSPSWTELSQDGSIYLITYGDNVSRMLSLIEKNQLPVRLINARFIKPLDTEMLLTILTTHLPIIVLEDVTKISGLGSSILEFASENSLFPISFHIKGLPDEFIEQGKVEELYTKHHLDDQHLLELIQSLL